MLRSILVALLLVVCGPAAAQQPMPFAAGQEWTLWKLSSMTGGANFIIARVEDRDGLRIVHGSIIQRTAPPGPDAAPLPYYSAHIPITEEGLRRSVIGFVRADSTVPNGFEAAYRKWKAGCGGVFNRDIIEAVAALIMSQAKKPVIYDIPAPDDCQPVS